jgi:hypothetical protein
MHHLGSTKSQIAPFAADEIGMDACGVDFEQGYQGCMAAPEAHGRPRSIDRTAAPVGGAWRAVRHNPGTISEGVFLRPLILSPGVILE